MMHHHEHLQHRVRQTMIQEVLQLMSQVRHHRRGAAADLLQRGLRVHVRRRTHQRRVTDLAELGRHEVRRMALPLIHASQTYLHHDVLVLQFRRQRAREQIHEALRRRVDVVQRVSAGHDSGGRADVHDGATLALDHAGHAHLGHHRGHFAVQMDDRAETVLRKLGEEHGVLVRDAHVVHQNADRNLLENGNQHLLQLLRALAHIEAHRANVHMVLLLDLLLTVIQLLLGASHENDVDLASSQTLGISETNAIRSSSHHSPLSVASLQVLSGEEVVDKD